MNIAHLESSLNWGGQELRVIEQTQWLNANGHNGWIVARPQSAILMEAEKRGIPNTEIDFRGSANPKVIRKLIRFINQNKIELIDAHSNRDASYAMFAKWLTKVKVVRSRHVTTPIKHDFLHRLIWKYGNHQIITTANKINEQIIQLELAPASKVYTAKAGVDHNRYHANIDGSALKASLGIPSDHKVVSNIGMIREDKGQLFFVKACEIIAEQLPSVTFIQLGSATADTKAYESLVKEHWEKSKFKDRIKFIGYKSDIENYQALSDIVMICSIGTEAQTRLVSQAFLMENSMIATTVGGLPEMISHNNTGLLCPPQNPEALAEAAIKLLTDSKLAATLRKNAYQHAMEEMTFEKMMDGMLDIYKKVCA
ncbi:glycosyltransferase family 4 protein [Hahella sp. HN01]|uniref:glycosyltransferase family 4 protein n=1 Tax=Hahella sp. HN01 TaxID=2847262 RepID=UPI001C1F0CA9|nr:glycosyltransferase family 4 protein [Hahella sp. HN01]MBU6951596.1 glycosyltransferase family 4 protein [Hahella sp. HN01]